MDLETHRHLLRYKGNRLTEKERLYNVKRLYKLMSKPINPNHPDKDMIPYLMGINSFNFISTTGSCTGHYGDSRKGRAYILFRSALTPEETINRILKPMDKKYPTTTDIKLIGLHLDRLSYLIQLDNRMWEKQLFYFIMLLKGIDEELKTGGEITHD